MNTKEQQLKLDLASLVTQQNIDLEENIERYTVNKENRVTGQKVSHKNSKKKAFGVKSFVAVMISVSVLTAVGMMQHVGTRAIVNNINNSNIETSNISSIPSSRGFIFYKVFPDGSRAEIDTDEYLKDLINTGKKAGFSIDEMAIYIHYKYGVTPHVLNSENEKGTTFIGRTAEKIGAYNNLMGNNIEEGRSK